MSKYVNVNLKRELMDKVDAAVENDLYTVSRAEFVRRAIEYFLKEAR